MHIAFGLDQWFHSYHVGLVEAIVGVTVSVLVMIAGFWWAEK